MTALDTIIQALPPKDKLKEAEEVYGIKAERGGNMHKRPNPCMLAVAASSSKTVTTVNTSNVDPLSSIVHVSLQDIGSEDVKLLA